MILADENQHPFVVARLREAGYTVEFVRETTPGASDRDILARPDIASFVLVTYDRDFGDPIFNHGLPTPAAILYTRLDRADPAYVARRLLELLEAGVPLGQIITITKDGTRSRPFSTGA